MDAEPPAQVELPGGASSALYRLVRQPGSGRPARDQLGNYVYVPTIGAGGEQSHVPRPLAIAQPSAAGE